MDNIQFLNAVDSTLKIEGGRVIDSDGLTNRGITEPFLREAQQNWPEDLDIQAMSIQNISESQALKLYKLQVWDKLGLDRIAKRSAVQAKVFDVAVNLGNYHAVHLLQNAVMDAGGERIRCDGILGPVTVQAVNWSVEPDLIRWYKVGLIARYYTIIKQYPEKTRNIRGWIWRAVG
jgi:lysozyme family protein